MMNWRQGLMLNITKQWPLWCGTCFCNYLGLISLVVAWSTFILLTMIKSIITIMRQSTNEEYVYVQCLCLPTGKVNKLSFSCPNLLVMIIACSSTKTKKKKKSKAFVRSCMFWYKPVTNELIILCNVILRAWLVRHRHYLKQMKTLFSVLFSSSSWHMNRL